jgi:hypothetical protein
MLCLFSVTKKQLKFQGCAVVKIIKNNRCTYYFELHQDRTDHIDSWKAGVYSSPGYMLDHRVRQSRLSQNSDRIWCQGPRGGVKIVKNRLHKHWSDKSNQGKLGYVTNNKELMKDFA